MQYFSVLASFCSQAGWFGPYLVRKHKDRFLRQGPFNFYPAIKVYKMNAQTTTFVGYSTALAIEKSDLIMLEICDILNCNMRSDWKMLEIYDILNCNMRSDWIILEFVTIMLDIC